MAFKSQKSGLSRGKPLQSKTGLKTKSSLQTKKPLQAKSSFTAKPQSPLDQIKAQKKALQAATIRALEKARQDAVEQGVELSEWENEFIEGVTERVKTYGRAFADPDKGAMNGTLSLRQGMKLKEIRKKAQKGKQTGLEADEDEK